MRLVVILTLGLGVCGPALINAEKIVFVVPRYVRRSYTTNAMPFSSQGEPSLKIRQLIRGGKRPFFTSNFGPSPIKNVGFFAGEKYRIPQGGEDFDQGHFAPHQEVNHVVIPHGKGISHGISFGKGYIPHDEFKGGNENYNEFPSGNGNNLDYAAQNHQEDVKFEDEVFQRFQNQDHGSGTRNTEWPFKAHESGYAPVNYDQETNREESLLELQEGNKGQETSSAPKQELFFQKSMSGEEPRAILEENLAPARIPDNLLPTPAPLIMPERKLTPIILRDTVDMKEYVERVEAFAKSWPNAAGLQGFQWKKQILNPPGLTIPNYQGFNSWSSNSPKPQSGSYEVQEDSVEEPSQINYRTIIM